MLLSQAELLGGEHQGPGIAHTHAPLSLARQAHGHR